MVILLSITEKYDKSSSTRLYAFLTTVFFLILNWWEKKAKPQIVRIEVTKSYLEDRIIFCPNCDTQTTLWRYMGSLVCSSCNSDSWVYPITVRPRIDPEIMKKVLSPSGKGLPTSKTP